MGDALLLRHDHGSDGFNVATGGLRDRPPQIAALVAGRSGPSFVSYAFAGGQWAWDGVCRTSNPLIRRLAEATGIDLAAPGYEP